ncbi:MAG: hypothetical protein ACUZ8E_17345 [Candidatus Anammoxibacter sp.]
MTTQAQVNTAQKIFSQEEKTVWAKFEAIRDAKYTGKGSRAVKFDATNKAREVLKAEMIIAEDKFAAAVA